MAVDVLFTDGIIAAKEKYLLKDKLARMCEMSADEAFRVVSESGFGGIEGATVFDYDKLVAADEEAIDSFVREYAPTNAELCYLLSPRDFHNAKALTKAEYLNESADKMLAPNGIIPAETLLSCFKAGDFSALSGELGQAIKGAVEQAESYLKGEKVSGAEVGAIFDRAMFAYLCKACKRNSTLKKLITAKADMTNILTALRSDSEEDAAKFYVEGGKLKKEQLSKLFDGADNAVAAFNGSGYESFLKLCLAAKAKGMPLTDAERFKDSYECEYLAANKYELRANQPFLYYVFRRRAENENVRIIFVCLLGGMNEREIKSRLRGA
jgi:V/A-type H+-transporting ATPase subunit C